MAARKSRWVQGLRLVVDADQGHTGLGLATVLDLQLAVKAGRQYAFRFLIPFNSNDVNNGSRWVTSGPAGPIWGRSSWSTGASAQVVNYFAAHGLPGGASSTSLIEGNIAELVGTFAPTADGTLAVQFTNETSVGVITVRPGAFCELITLY